MPSGNSGVFAQLSSIKVTNVQQNSLLQVFGLKWDMDAPLDYLTLDESLAQNLLEVTELNPQGRVSAIKVSNRSEGMVFLMVGEVLVGCKQDRILGTSMLVPAETEMSIPVACVEAGRWRYQSAKFKSDGFSSYATLRGVLSKTTSQRLREKGDTLPDQEAVWLEIGRKMRATGSVSSTGALKDMFLGYSSRLNQLQQDLRAPSGCHGVAVASGDKILGAELFDKPSTLVMTLEDALAFIAHLQAAGLRINEPEMFREIALVDQIRGFHHPCDWLEFGTVEGLPAVRLVGSEHERIVIPDFEFESKALIPIPKAELERYWELVRTQENVQVYRHKRIGEIVYVGRTQSQVSRKWFRFEFWKR